MSVPPIRVMVFRRRVAALMTMMRKKTKMAMRVVVPHQ